MGNRDQGSKQEHILAGASAAAAELGSDEMLPPEADKISLEQAMRSHTIDAAHMLEAEPPIGPVEAGKRADLVVLDRDTFAVSPEEMTETLALKTLVDRRLVLHRAKALGELDEVKVEVTNPDLQSALDIEQLNLLVEDETLGFSAWDAQGWGAHPNAYGRTPNSPRRR